MKIVLAAPGQLTHPGTQALASDYTERIARIVPFERCSGRTMRRGRRAGSGERATALETEALFAALPDRARPIALVPEGRRMDSEAFAKWLIARLEEPGGPLAFLVFGPDGPDRQQLGTARWRLSLGPMTLPHELAEVVALEQIYRALTLWRGLPYHR